MMKKTLLLIIYLFLTIQGVSFQLISDIGSSADMISRGNVEGFSNGSQLVFENPSALSTLKSYSASFFTTRFFSESTFNAISFSMPSQYGSIGFGYMSNSVDNVPKTSNTELMGYFNYSNKIYNLSYSKPMFDLYENPLYLGVSLLSYEHDLNVSIGKATDVGISSLYQINDIDLSLTLRNILSSDLKYNSGKKESLPVEYIMSTKFNHNVFPIYTQIKRVDSTYLLSASFDYHPKISEKINFSLGYKSINVLKKVNHNITYGLQLLLQPIRLSYAYESSDHILYDNKHYFSLTYIK